MRKMVTFRVIDDVQDIEGADKIQVATVGGWKVVIKRDEFKPGDIGIYHEIDCWLPFSNPAYAFLMKPEGENKIFEGVEGVRLRTIKLRGQISQGLLLPISAFMDCDLASSLGVGKWEKYLNTCGSMKPKGNFPFFIPKTDQERVQNISKDIGRWALEDNLYEITEKLDGSSCTIYVKDGAIGVCSRNLELLRDEDSLFWKVVEKYGLEEKLIALGGDIALQGELTAWNVQGNPYKHNDGEFHFHVFDVFDIERQEYMASDDRVAMTKLLEVPHVPVIYESSRVPAFVDEVLRVADGQSFINDGVLREGLVFKNKHKPEQSFKAISNKWLLGEKE